MQDKHEILYVKTMLGIGLISALCTGALPYLPEATNSDGTINIEHLVMYSFSALTTATALGLAGAVAFGRTKN